MWIFSWNRIYINPDGDRFKEDSWIAGVLQAAFSIEWLKTKDIGQSLKAGSVAASEVLCFTGGVKQTNES